MVNHEDHETYRALVYTMCDKYMIMADPHSLTIKINIDSDEYQYIEIQVAMIGCHIKVYNRVHIVIHRSFLKGINNVLGYIAQY